MDRTAMPLTLALLAATIAGCDRSGAVDTPTATTGSEPAIASAPSTLSRSRVSDNPPGWPPVEFEPAELDFGLLDPGEIARGMVHLHNVGDEPLRIRASSTSCGCTTTDRLDGQTIGPRSSIEFAVEMEPKPGLGDKKEGVRILFVGYETRVEFYFKARVAFPVHVTPPHITATAAISGELVVESQDGTPFAVLWSNGERPDFVDFDPATDALRNRYTFRWDLTDMVAANAVPWFWVIETDRPECPVIDIRVRHASTIPHRPRGRPWVPKGQRVLVGHVATGEPVDVTAKIEYSAGRSPSAGDAEIRSTSSRFTAELLDVSVDGQFLKYSIRITPTAGAAGLLNEKIEMVASGFSAPVYVIGRIIEPDG